MTSSINNTLMNEIKSLSGELFSELGITNKLDYSALNRHLCAIFSPQEMETFKKSISLVSRSLRVNMIEELISRQLEMERKERATKAIENIEDNEFAFIFKWAGCCTGPNNGEDIIVRKKFNNIMDFSKSLNQGELQSLLGRNDFISVRQTLANPNRVICYYVPHNYGDAE